MSRIKSLSFLLMLLLVIATVSTAFAATKTFHANGKLESETFFNPQNKAKEKALWYDQNGLLQAEEKFTSDNSKIVTFYTDKGLKKSEETIVDGKRVRVRAFLPQRQRQDSTTPSMMKSLTASSPSIVRTGRSPRRSIIRTAKKFKVFPRR